VVGQSREPAGDLLVVVNVEFNRSIVIIDVGLDLSGSSTQEPHVRVCDEVRNFQQLGAYTQPQNYLLPQALLNKLGVAITEALRSNRSFAVFEPHFQREIAKLCRIIQGFLEGLAPSIHCR